MNLRIAILIFFCHSCSSQSDLNSFVSGFFGYKRVAYVTGYLCNDTDNDNNFIKLLSQNSKFSSLTKLTDNTTVKSFLQTRYRKIGVVLDTRCHSPNATEDLLAKASFALMYGDLHCWLILGSDYEVTLSLLNDTEFTVTTDLTVAIKESENETYVLYDVYNPCKYRGGLLNSTFLGSWTNRGGLVVNLTQEKFLRRENLWGLTLRIIALVQSRPQNVSLEDYLLDYGTKQLDTSAKYAYAIYLHMADMFNFTVETEETKTKILNNRNAMIMKKLVERTAELGGNTGVSTIERLATMTMIPAWPLRTCFIFRTTPAKHIKINHFLKPLTSETWYSLILTMLITILVFSLSLITRDLNSNYESYSDAIVVTIGCVCQQGSELSLSTFSSRIALLQMMIFSLLIYNYYSASVVSARLSEPLEKINDSLNELGKLEDVKLGAEWTFYFNSYIKRPDWEAQQFYNNRWSKIPDKEKYVLPYDGIMRVLKGNYAYHVDVNVAYPLIERWFDNRETCQLTKVNLVRPTDSCLFMAKNGSFTEMARVGIARMRQLGLRNRQIRRWAAREPVCRSDVLSMDPVTIYEAAPALLLLCMGVIFSLIISIFEAILYFFSHWNYKLCLRISELLSHFKRASKTISIKLKSK